MVLSKQTSRSGQASTLHGWLCDRYSITSLRALIEYLTIQFPEEEMERTFNRAHFADSQSCLRVVYVSNASSSSWALLLRGRRAKFSKTYETRSEYPLPADSSNADNIEINVEGIISDTTLSSACWIFGSKLTGMQLYDSCVLILRINSETFAILLDSL